MSGPIVGIDADTHRVAWASIWENQVWNVQTIKRVSKGGVFSASYDDEMGAFFDNCRESNALLLIEDCYLPITRAEYVQQHCIETFKALARVQGEILAAARRIGLEIQVVAPCDWQRTILGHQHGRRDLKAASRRQARSLWPNFETEHEADAICIAFYGAYIRGIEAERDLGEQVLTG